jgi:hypothetical protein
MGNLLGPVVFLAWLILVSGAVFVAVAVFRGGGAEGSGGASHGESLGRDRRRRRADGR